MKNTLFLLIISLFLLSACRDDACKPTSYMAYLWEIPVTLSPAKDTFNIGDTITITSFFSDTVYEQVYGQTYKLIDYKFHPFTSIRKLDTLTNNQSAFISDISYAKFIIPNGTLYYVGQNPEEGTSFLGDYSYHNNTYSLEYKLVLKKTGLFVLNHESYLDLYTNINGNSQNFEGKCDEWTNAGVINLNNQADNNINMLNGVPTNSYIETLLKDPKQRFHDKGGYIFYVKE